MGAGPSLGKLLKSMDDDDLVQLVESAYKLEPQRMEKVFALARQRHYEETGLQPPREMDAAAALSLSAALLQSTQTMAPSPAPPMLGEMLPAPPMTSAASSSATVMHSVGTTPSMEMIPDASDDHPVLAGDRDPMNALWTFEGHHLRKLRTADTNPHNASSHLLQPDHFSRSGGGIDLSTGVATLPQRELDADGYAVMYGSCGRNKRYGRCTVCYYRGLRCNTDHYCACCQKSVCIRPRMYPGEEHQKICWNVLHMDKEIVNRVQKKKRKLQTATATASVAVAAAARLKNVEAFTTGVRDADRIDRPNGSLNHSAVDLHRAPSIPTVVADVSGAVDL
ncbi:hypothetical protein PHYPSEUDO_007533 [Phytophthora pseudosyringae]|uniref:Uncharacterized protein n=1 Tax=Phytophthora pseudosyringae TaxID=221518 RepID=A0A8T1WEZ2_9STRA|nr:hypothetical protein PHYPSEUDO_007533 [Phytophthora pseudosyringae]